MPIISIINQPDINDLKAAYRPIVFTVRASRTDGNAHPPVVYCDIYVNGIYYKSTPKTQYTVLNSTDSDWQFDISNPMQEVLKTFLATNGGSAIVEGTNVMALVYCKFRSSGYNADGFITPEGTAPIQGTGSVDAVAGTGTQSNSFYVPNVVLQHEQNQNLKAHLNFYKNGTWSADVYPLTHRKNNYKICNGDSDYFPVINLSDKDLSCIKISYKLKGSNDLLGATNCIAPVTCADISSINGVTQKTPVTCASIDSINGVAEKEVVPPTQVTGFIEVQGSKKVVVTLDDLYDCDLEFNLLGTYDLGGPVEFSAPITVVAGGYTGQYNITDGIITCMKASETGTNTVVYGQTCNGISYVFTLTIISAVCE
jgi:hypothetical protein